MGGVTFLKKSIDFAAEVWQWAFKTVIHSSPIFKKVMISHLKSLLLDALVLWISWKHEKVMILDGRCDISKKKYWFRCRGVTVTFQNCDTFVTDFLKSNDLRYKITTFGCLGVMNFMKTWKSNDFRFEVLIFSKIGDECITVLKVTFTPLQRNLIVFFAIFNPHIQNH